jgi:hypothetical protein
MNFDWKHIVLVLIIGAASFAGVYQCNRKSHFERLSEEKAKQLDKLVQEFKNSKPDTIYDSLRVIYAIKYKPVPVKVHDTVFVDTTRDVKLCEEWYEDTYKFQKGRLNGSIHWKAYVRNCKIEQLSFPDIVSPKEIITNTILHDTCYAKSPEYRPKNHWGAGVDLLANSFKEFPGCGANIWFSYKDKWGLKAGGIYLPQNNAGYATLGAIIYFK